MKKTIYSTHTPWEEKVGYCRAIKVGPFIEVSGTTSVDKDQLIGKGDAFAQADFIFKKIEKALQAVGSSLDEVVRTRMYITNIDDAPEVMRAHGKYFKGINPASALIGIQALVWPDMLVEIEVSAIARHEA